MAGPEDETDEFVWVTVSDAARYLGISEATIRRWMEEGLLRHQKVGGSHRVLQNALDQLVRQATTRARVEAAAGRCICCGSCRLVEGGMQGTGKLYFKPQKARFWVLEESLVSVRANVCKACGFVQLHADTDKIERIVPPDQDDTRILFENTEPMGEDLVDTDGEQIPFDERGALEEV